ncbi:exodeoxyribonuclease VII large subunit [Poriferisphaera sp. WC338]|uniref:exodeoxyribonuclease VII large subunit n=1 Tax=Poriferisphaera sp. WC338 TaxID=3425129 RepID=UPI003D81BCBF
MGKVSAKSGGGAMTVSEVAERVRYALAEGFGGKVRVVGEVSNLSDRAHWFFSLKDAGAALRCVCFASNARRVSFPVRDGMEVVVTGRMDFYDAQGSVQLYVDKIEPVGVGALELAYRQLVEELKELGYFEVERKKALPRMCRKIAVVTSRSAAALQDVIDTASRRWAGCELVLCDVRVQGEQAASEIARAINDLSRRGKGLGIDALIVTRGGGSMEDLWAFNERVVADAIYKCSLPIIAAIGHETDITIAELVADHRCATPTQAAMMLVPDSRAMREQVEVLRRRLEMVMRREVESGKHRVAHAARHVMFDRPGEMVERMKGKVDGLSGRLLPALRERVVRGGMMMDGLVKEFRKGLPREIRRAEEKLEAMERELKAVGPDSVLRRGYSYTTDEQGKVVKSVGDVEVGSVMATVLADGELRSRVTKKEGGGGDRDHTRKAKKKITKKKTDENGPMLF